MDRVTDTWQYERETLIYFLLDKGKVVYVGQSKTGLLRIKQHIFEKAKKFDDYKIIRCNEEDLDDLENFYILKYNPKYNKRLNNSMVDYLRLYNRLETKTEFNPYKETFIKKIVMGIKENYVEYKGKKKINIKLADKIIDDLLKSANEILEKYTK